MQRSFSGHSVRGGHALMNTPTHAILNLAILGRKHRPEWNVPIIWGGFIPDLALFAFFGWTTVATDLSSQQIWGEAYYAPFWQNLFVIWNSIPLALLGIGTGLWLRRYQQALGTTIAICCASILLHCLEDLPLHREDAHRHFWPLSNYRFESPVSYWDPAHHGDVFAVFELGLSLMVSVYVFRLLRSRLAKGLLIFSNLLFLVFFVGFYLR
ncbi:MAG: hypothetical protein AAF282_09855 [Cyanobacteria bacterium P01_A01_bin.15]